MAPPDAHPTLALVIACATLAGVAFGRLPFVPLGRAGFALVGRRRCWRRASSTCTKRSR
jgi:hypothetical protein